MYTPRRQRIVSGTLTATLMFAGLSLTGVLTEKVKCSEQLKSFEFGPGTPQHHSHYRTLLVPARTSVNVAVQLQRDPGPTDVPVFIEVRQASADSIGTTGPDGPRLNQLLATAGTGLQTVTFQNQSFSSQFACPSTWRVRVATTNGQAPPVRVFGTIIYVFTVPGTVTVDMEGGTQHLDPNAIATRTLAGISAGLLSAL